MSIYVMLELYTEFQCPSMAGTDQQVCGGMVAVCKPIIVFSVAQAEQKQF